MSVVIAADNIISSLGTTSEEVTDALRAGRSGLKKLERFHLPIDEDVIASLIPKEAECKEVNGKHINATRLEKLMMLSVAKAAATLTGKYSLSTNYAADLLASPRTIFIISTTKGNIGILDKEHPQKDNNQQLYLWHSAKTVSSYFHNPNIPIVISNACISGIVASIVAKREIERGSYDTAVVVGADEVTEFIVSGFSSFKALSSAPCRPFDKSRNGLNLGEAVGTMILQVADSVTQIGAGHIGNKVFIEAGAISNDANHISGPSRTGEGLYRAIMQCITKEMLELGAENHGFLSPHGTATIYNDQMEAVAISRAGLSGIPAFSLKGYLGHTVGACGVIETILCARFLMEGFIPESLGYEESGVEPSMNISRRMRKLKANWCLKTGSGFGGCNAVIRMELGRNNDGNSSEAKQCESGEEVMRLFEDRSSSLLFKGDVKAKLDELYRSSGMQYPKFFKMDLMCKAAMLLMEKILGTPEQDLANIRRAPAEAKEIQENTAVLLMNSSSSLQTDRNFQETIGKNNFFPSPSIFVYTLPNIAHGEICIRYRFYGEGIFFVSEHDNDRVLEYAKGLLNAGLARRVILMWLEVTNENLKAEGEKLQFFDQY